MEQQIRIIYADGWCYDRLKNIWRHIIMYFDAIAKIVSERTGCDVSAVKPESKFA